MSSTKLLCPTLSAGSEDHTGSLEGCLQVPHGEPDSWGWVRLEKSPRGILMPMALCPAENQNQAYGTLVTAGIPWPREVRAPAPCLAAPLGRGSMEDKEAHAGLKGVGWKAAEQRAVVTLVSPLPGLPNRAMSSFLGDSGVFLKLAPFLPSCRKLGKPRMPWWAEVGYQGLRGPPKGGLGAAPSGRRTGSYAVPQTGKPATQDIGTCHSRCLERCNPIKPPGPLSPSHGSYSVTFLARRAQPPYLKVTLPHPS